MKNFKKNFFSFCLICMILALSSPLTVSAGTAGQTTQGKETTQSDSEQLFASLKRVGVMIANAKFKYGKSAKTNFNASKKKKRSFCADYVTWDFRKTATFHTACAFTEADPENFPAAERKKF